MRITKVEGLQTIAVRTTEPDADGWVGAAALLFDRAGDFHGVFFWLPESHAEFFLVGLRVDGHGPEYEIRDESTDIYVPTKKGTERVEQTREFIRPRNSQFEFVPVVKRVEFGKSEPEGFQTYAIPARTTT